jgi:hypothetical protein
MKKSTEKRLEALESKTALSSIDCDYVAELIFRSIEGDKEADLELNRLSNKGISILEVLVDAIDKAVKATERPPHPL